MDAGTRVIFHDNCKLANPSISRCAGCEHDGDEATVKSSTRGEAVIEFADGKSLWAEHVELEVIP